MEPAVQPAPQPVVRLLPELLDRAAQRNGDAPFVLRWSSGGWTGYSFAEASRAMHAFARRLAELGAAPGTRVGLVAENRPEWGLAYLAVLLTGASVVPLDVQLTSRELAEALRSAEARLCVISDRTREQLDRVRREGLPQVTLVSLDPAGEQPSWEQALRDHQGKGPLPAPGNPEDLAALIFTSGTTGRPKGVMLTHSNLLHNVEAVARTFEFGPADRLLSVLPLHHTFECTVGFLCALRVEASIAYARGLKSNELREDMTTSRATILLGVPLLYEKMLAGIHRGIGQAPLPKRALARGLLAITRVVRWLTGLRLGTALLRPIREAAGLGSIRLLVSGAAALPNEVFWGFTDLGFLLLEGYGLTECSPVVAGNHPPKPRPGGVGWPLPGLEVRIDDPDRDGNGEILVRGPSVKRGYWRDPQLTAETLRDGWYHTGDLGRFLADGRLRITGRLKNMIATAAGKKIYPEEIELRLADCPYILEVVVVGGRDASGEREEVHAYVYPDRVRLEELAGQQGQACDDAYIERVIRKEIEARSHLLAPYKRVKRVIVRHEEFPKTTTGKIRRQGLGGAAAGEAERAAIA